MATTRKKEKNGRLAFGFMIGIHCPINVSLQNKKPRIWAAQEETRRTQKIYFSEQIAKKHTLATLIDQYIEQALPAKPKSGKDILRNLLWWKEKLGNYAIGCMTPEVITKHRRQLMDGITSKRAKRSPEAVNHYMASLSIALIYAVKDCRWTTGMRQEEILKTSLE